MHLSSSFQNATNDNGKGRCIEKMLEGLAHEKAVSQIRDIFGNLYFAPKNKITNRHSTISDFPEGKNVVAQTASAHSLRRTSSSPKDMHLICRDSSLPTANSLGLAPASSVRRDPSHFIRRVLSYLREADTSPLGKVSPISVRTSPGYFMRGLLSDLQQVEKISTGGIAQSLPSISQQMNPRHFERRLPSNLQESVSFPKGEHNRRHLDRPI